MGREEASSLQPLVIAFGALFFVAGTLLLIFRDSIFDYYNSHGVTYVVFKNKDKSRVSPVIRLAVPLGWMSLGFIVLILGLVLPPYKG
jgi:hypothetical protein